MPLHQLRVRRAVARHRNPRRAAEPLHLTGPAVSMPTRDPQRRLGLALVEAARAAAPRRDDVPGGCRRAAR